MTENGIDLSGLRLTRSKWVAASPMRVYELVSDVSAMAAWSPDLVHARYDETHGPTVGSWFTGRNRDETHEWDTRMRITEAEPGVSFAWIVTWQERDDITRWRYRLQPHDRGTLVVESWHVLRLPPVVGSTRAELLELRSRTASSMEATLAALASSVASSAAIDQEP